ncbi:sensor histidine kinase [Thauera sp.]|jgi:two-component system sensor histidine kinase AlgZ|uniref:sensor histidine kinase n=1 Tax=Thauera sp. TaxID=1905334 RepID=UPI002A36A5FB|nr:histidine kinase [Thauera sp.]MDX9885153.1 histidine kinase [Thauera sp.]
MPESIKQKPARLAGPGLPDFRNLGVMLRVLLVVNLLALLTVALRADQAERLVAELALMAGRVELPLLLAVLLLYLLGPALRRLGARAGQVAVFAVASLAVLVSSPLTGADAPALLRALAWSWLAAAIALLYFDYRSWRFTPALAEARLMALTARIRPHFFFNSLNGVLGVIRSDPRRAERALEELADLFRALMQDHRERVPLRDEVALCERYVDIERLRLGERLLVRWEFAGAGDAGATPSAMREALLDAHVPPLLLQPLLENAVYHGIEPSTETGEVVVRVARRGEVLSLEVDNPVCDAVRHHAGNRMALDNIRERLMLFYDLEAGLEIDEGGGRYRVRIRLPYRTRD